MDKYQSLPSSGTARTLFLSFCLFPAFMVATQATKTAAIQRIKFLVGLGRLCLKTVAIQHVQNPFSFCDKGNTVIWYRFGQETKQRPFYIKYNVLTWQTPYPHGRTRNMQTLVHNDLTWQTPYPAEKPNHAAVGSTFERGERPSIKPCHLYNTTRNQSRKDCDTL